jgi:hypothetical protein
MKSPPFWRCWECGKRLHATTPRRGQPHTPAPCLDHPQAEVIPWNMRDPNWAYATIVALAEHLRRQGCTEEEVEAVVLDYPDHQQPELFPELAPMALALAALRWLRWGRGPLPELRLPEPPANAPGLYGPKRKV